MPEETTEEAVIDRFEGAYAVLLVGPTQRPLDVPRQQLPDTARAGDWLRITLAAGAFRTAQLDPDATGAAQRRIQAKLARLRRGDHLKE